ncbi:MAG: hypothetical protein V4735_07490 [Pseudomonadota bacterium]
MTQRLGLWLAVMLLAGSPAFAQPAPITGLPPLPLPGSADHATPPTLPPLGAPAGMVPPAKSLPTLPPTATGQLPPVAPPTVAPAAGAQALPPLNLPSSPVAAPAAALAPVAAVPAPAAVGAPTPPTAAAPQTGALPAVPQNYTDMANNPADDDDPQDVYSYGRSNVSVLFLPAQVEQMKDAIRSYEALKSQGRAAAATVVGINTQAAAPEIIAEPKNYPVFYLSSIAYRSAGDWSIWVSGHKITAAKNTTDVNVIRASADSVTFSWLPSYAVALHRRKSEKLFAPTDALKNKLSTAQRVGIDDQTGMVTFTLHANQSFGVAYFSVFEGYVDSPELKPLVNAPSTAINITSAPPAEGQALPAPQPAPANPLMPDVTLPATPTFSLPNQPLRQ